jgi:hypothetical protein
VSIALKQHALPFVQSSSSSHLEPSAFRLLEPSVVVQPHWV